MPISRSGRARLAVTLGDAAGIGPEVALKALASFQKISTSPVIVIGPETLYRALARKFHVKLRFDRICFFFPFVFPKTVRYGRANDTLSTLAVHSVELAVTLAMGRQVDAVVTPPINKAAVNRAGFNIPGHTEYLAELSRTKRYDMMLVGGPLRTVLVTRHMAVADVSKALTKKKIIDTALLADRELRRSFGIRRPRLVICGLNPHAGEEGKFGREEITVITPAVRELRRLTDAEITGPLAPDALFVDAYRGRYDAEICMYHDQGLIPLKMISRGHGVNVTLGLPFVRTSPDHGTAYDIAGRGAADEGSMLDALRLAEKMTQRRKAYDRSRR